MIYIRWKHTQTRHLKWLPDNSILLGSVIKQVRQLYLETHKWKRTKIKGRLQDISERRNHFSFPEALSCHLLLNVE